MPAYSTHYIFAKELKDTIENQVDFKLDEAAYYIGTQGPDIFFDHRVMPWMLGKSLRKTGSKPVSYTHLDVYKRQELHKGIFYKTLLQLQPFGFHHRKA